MVNLAGSLTEFDWQNMKTKLVNTNVSNEPDLWAEAYERFFRQRLSLRYLKPIELIQKKGTWEGEGFTIVSIQCALIEFLAAIRKGKNYKHGGQLGPYEYSRSRDLFVDFLSSVQPFCRWFSDATATDFYGSVRCALLHEACTRNGWTIWATGNPPIDAERKKVFRNDLQNELEEYVNDYGNSLLNDRLLQKAFVRKFDCLASH